MVKFHILSYQKSYRGYNTSVIVNSMKIIIFVLFLCLEFLFRILVLSFVKCLNCIEFLWCFTSCRIYVLKLGYNRKLKKFIGLFDYIYNKIVKFVVVRHLLLLLILSVAYRIVIDSLRI